MKKALVTGAAGFIGSHVVRELLSEGVSVRAMVLPGENTRNIDGLDIQTVQADVMDRRSVEKAMKGVDTLFHLAAIYSIWMKDWKNIYEVNMAGSRNVLRAAKDAGVKRVVYTSSIAALGIAPGKELSAEETPFNQYDLGSHYVLTKYLSQQEALWFADQGLDLVVVNPAFPFGPRDVAPTPTGQLIVDILKGQNIFYFSGGINLVDVRDVARGHVLAAKKGKRGNKYILGNLNVTMKEFITMVYRAAGFRYRIRVRMPVPALKQAARVFKWWSDAVSHRPPLTTPVEVRYSSQYLFFDPSKARKELGLQPTPLEKSLRDSVEWFRKNNYI
jgi:dihydroflavonol-4-reductase